MDFRKASDSHFAVPIANGLGVFPIRFESARHSLKIEHIYPLVLPHAGQVCDFAFSPVESSILASCVRNSGVVRIWKLPSDIQSEPVDPQREMEGASVFLSGHDKKVSLEMKSNLRSI